MKKLVCNKKNLMAVFASLFLLNVQLALANFPRERGGDGDLPVFDFSKNYPEKRLCLQDIAEIEYVPLETTDEILLGGSSVLSAVTDNYILIHEERLGDIFLFDRKTGKIVSHFNHKGQSGREYNWIKNGTVLDEEKGEIYVCSQYMQVYSLTGEYKRTLKISWALADLEVYNFDDESLLIYYGTVIEPSFEKLTKKSPYRLVSKKDGSVIDTLPLHFEKRYSNVIAQKLDGNMWRPYGIYYPQNNYFGKDLMIADISSDTLYRLSPEKGLVPLLKRKPSTHDMDPRAIWFPLATTDNFFYFGTFLLDFNSKGGPIPTYMYDFGTGEFYKAPIKDAEYDTRSWRASMWAPNAAPAIKKNEVAELIQVSDMLEANQGKRLAGNGAAVVSKLLEDDNPVVRIIKFK